MSGGITWDDANAAASASGTYLATITSVGENDFVFGLISDSPEFWVVAGTVYWGPWLGGSDEVTEGTWEWITGEPWVYENWGAGQPDDSGGQDHLHFRGEPAPASEWDDFHRDAPSVAYITETLEIPIPSVSEWGLVVITLLGMTAGTIMLGRRQPIHV